MKMWHLFLLSPFPVNILLEIRINTARQEKEIEVKLSVCEDDIIAYVKNPYEYIKKLLESTDKFSNVSGNKFNIEKPIIYSSYYYGGQNNDLLKISIP